MSLGATKNPPSRRVFSCPEGNVGGRSRPIPLTLPYPQTPSLGEGAGGRSRLAGLQALSLRSEKRPI